MPRTIAFFEGSMQATGSELWETDGTAGGTVLVADIVSGPVGSHPGDTGFAATGTGLVVFGADDGGSKGAELFTSDGTTAGTVELSNAFIEVGNSYAFGSDRLINLLRGFAPLGDGRILFTGATSPNSLQLWSTNGTVAGTGLVQDLVGTDTSITTVPITPIGNGKALFSPSFGTQSVSGLWGTDGTAAGTVLLSPYSSVLVSLGDGRALTNISSSDGSLMLGVTDGTAAGTAAIRGFATTNGATAIGSGRALLSASDGQAGRELWLTDGTAAGTTELLQGPPVAPGTLEPYGLDPNGFTPLGDGRFVFIGNDGTAANSVYVTDGTAAGTHLLAETGPAGSYRALIASTTPLANGRAAIQLQYGADGASVLLVTDGTAAGTGVALSLASIQRPGDQYPALVGNMAALPNGTAVFTVDDGTANLQLWRTDGTVVGTSKVATVTGGGRTSPQITALPDGRALFAIGNGDGTFSVWTTAGTAMSTGPIGVALGSDVYGQPYASDIRAFGVATVPDLDPVFDSDYYNAHNPDVAAAGLNAYQHFLAYGGAEGRSPDPFFDSHFYLQQNPDVAAAGIDPLTHFEQYGWKEGRDLSLLFSDAKYLAANPDLAAARVDPLQHYLQFGKAEGRATFLSGGVEAADPLVQAAFYDPQLGATLIPTGLAAAQQAAWSYDTGGWQRGLNPDPLFDTAYYLSHNPDVAAAHINPLLHYEQFGWKEGRDPSAAFSTAKYLAANPDVAAAGLDPLLHYVAFGQNEGRAIYPA